MTTRYSIYCGVYKLERVTDVMEKKFGRDAEAVDERMDGENCLFALLVTRDGRPLLDSLTLSSCAWAVGRTLTSLAGTSGWLEGFEEDAQRMTDKVRLLLAADKEDEEAQKRTEQGFPMGRPLTLEDLQRATELVAHELGVNGALQPAGIRVKAGLVARKKPYSVDDNDFLNSFFLRDLQKVGQQVSSGRLGTGLKAYLNEQPEMSHRTDVREQLEVVLGHLAPDRFPQGRWPSKGHYPLVLSQQFAVNTALQNLTGGGLFAVNGPPGTGKTTLLRDIVAAIIVERATRLSNLSSPASAFTGKSGWKTGMYNRAVHLWKPELQGFEIVVASSNNGAVENVTIEIPKISEIDQSWLDEADYFAGYGSRIIGQDAWAMLAAKLGNKSNRGDFVSNFWYPADQEATKAHLEDRKPPRPEDGFLEFLRYSQGQTVSWSAAVKRFKQALAAEQQLRTERMKVFELFVKRDHLTGQLASLPENEEQARHQLNDVQSQHTRVQTEYLAAEQAIEQAKQQQDVHLKRKPNWVETMFSLGRVSREWRDKETELTQALEKTQAAARPLKQQIDGLQRAVQDAEKLSRDLQRSRTIWDKELNETHAALENAHRAFPNIPTLTHWQELGEKRELSSPWADQEWDAARARVFLEALRLHKAFIVANAEPMRQSLQAAMDILSGGVPPKAPPEAIKAAWTALFFAVPVISTTFASFDRLFSHLGAEDLGYLLIDEAGQAVPQAAAGAIWRARRTIVVGDPLQLEPVVTIPNTAQQALRRHHQVSELWLPSRTSTQQLADRVSSFGTSLPSDDSPLWVGSPLRVHRRCDHPMFDISNGVAYDGLMVYGTTPREPLTLPESAWIDVQATEADSHFIPAEGGVARQLVEHLLAADITADQIYVISPFRVVIRELQHLLPLPRERVGTIHTTQGKEADVIILVLGGHPARPGAKAWASQRPNLLNVAVSRAKRRLYVIGNHDAWQKQKHFSVMARQLPQSTLPETFSAPVSGQGHQLD